MSGKDSAAGYLKRQLENKGNKATIMHFAQYIKDYLKNYYGWNGITKDEYWRTKLQQLGTDIIKEKLNMKCFHAKRIAEDIQILQGDFDYFLIPDCRFRDEVHTIKAMFPDETITIRIKRLGFDNGLTEEQKSHRSETDLDDFKFDKSIIVQSGLQHLYDETDRILGKMLGYLN